MYRCSTISPQCRFQYHIPAEGHEGAPCKGPPTRGSTETGRTPGQVRPRSMRFQLRGPTSLLVLVLVDRGLEGLSRNHDKDSPGLDAGATSIVQQSANGVVLEVSGRFTRTHRGMIERVGWGPIPCPGRISLQRDAGRNFWSGESITQSPDSHLNRKFPCPG
jgi:hypothetical protein